MRDSRNSAAAPFRMTVFQQMCDLIAVLAVNGHFKAVAVFLDLFCSPALFVSAGLFRSIGGNFVLDCGRCLFHSLFHGCIGKALRIPSALS